MTAPAHEATIVPAPVISASPAAGAQEASWRRILAESVRDPAELLKLLDLPDNYEPAARRAAATFPLLAPRPYIARMRRGDPDDPLLRQILPLDQELDEAPGFTTDAVGDAAAQVAPALLHKYKGRALLMTTSACAVHCRYCFRRNYPYEGTRASLASWAPAIDHIAQDKSLHEVILSGGDPLSVVDETLAELAERLAAIPHVRRLRIHTRLPIVIPQRVTPGLTGWLRGTRLTPIMVVHANHAAELDRATGDALGRLIDAGVPVLNQAVLLRGVNDATDALADLSERLVDLRVIPYYLHQLDRVAGASHFEAPVIEGKKLVKALRRRLPGYAVPRYVREIAGKLCKLPL